MAQQTFAFASFTVLAALAACSTPIPVLSSSGGTMATSAASTGGGGADATSSTGGGGADTTGSTGIGGSGGIIWGCSGGNGQPKTVVQGVTGLLAVQASTLYVAHEGLIGEDGIPSYLYVAPLDCTEGEIVSLGLEHVKAVAVDAQNLYIGGDRIRKRTPNKDLVTLVSASGAVSGLAVDDTSVYWAASDGTIARVSTAGGSVTVLATGEPQPTSLAIDATHVYWLAYTAGELRQMPKAGGAPSTLASGLVAPRGLAADVGGVYWIDGGIGGVADGAVHKIPSGGGSVTTLASSLWSPRRLVANGQDVYWTDSAKLAGNAPAAMIERVSSQGGNVTVLEAGLPAADDLAIDATSVYWVGSDGVQSLPK
jgi:hypothetical protein